MASNWWIPWYEFGGPNKDGKADENSRERCWRYEIQAAIMPATESRSDGGYRGLGKLMLQYWQMHHLIRLSLKPLTSLQPI